MPSLINKLLSEAGALRNRWFQFGDDTTAPIHIPTNVSGELIDLAPLASNAKLRGQYDSPNGRKVLSSTSLDSLFSDDFGGVTLDVTNWDVLDGGLSANGTNLTHPGTITQAAIGSGTVGITDSVSASGLTVNMGTVNGAERWYLSKQVFAGKEDIFLILSKSQCLVANSIFIGIVEVDPVTSVPVANANFSGEFSNRGGVECGLTANILAYQAEALGDSSAAKASGNIGSSFYNSNVLQEYLVEIDSRDIIVSTSAVDSLTAKGGSASRVSSQCPNDKKLYKLVMRFRNVSAPGSNTAILIPRILVIDNYEQRVQVSSGEGDLIANKGVAVNLTGVGSGVQLSTLGRNDGGGGAVPLVDGAGRWSIGQGYADTTTSLGSAASYIGASRDLGQSFAGMAMNTSAAFLGARAYADQAGTLYIDESNDNSNWYLADSVAVAAGTGPLLTKGTDLRVPVRSRYWRVRYVNGATAQGAFRLISSQLGA